MLTEIDPTTSTRLSVWWLRVRRHLEEGTAYPRYQWLEHEARLHHALTMALWELQVAYRLGLGFDIQATTAELSRLINAAHNELIAAGHPCSVCVEET